MPTVHLPDGRVVHFPYDMSPAEIEREVSTLTGPAKPAKTTFTDDPSTWASGALQSLADTGVRTLKGVVRSAIFPVRHPIETLKSPYTLAKDLAAGGEGTLATLDAIMRGDPDVGGEALGGLLLGKVAPRLVKGVRRIAPQVARATKGLAGDVARGVGGNIPGVSPMFKGVLRERAARLERAQRLESLREGRLVPAEQPVAQAQAFNEVLTEALKADTATTPLEHIGGSFKPLGGAARLKRGAVESEIRGGMETFVPDKWGVSGMRRLDPVPAKTGPDLQALFKEILEQEEFSARLQRRALPPGRPPMITPPAKDPSYAKAVQPRQVVVRDPRTGRMRRVYTGESR